jgi:hypothetical protein
MRTPRQNAFAPQWMRAETEPADHGATSAPADGSMVIDRARMPGPDDLISPTIPTEAVGRCGDPRQHDRVRQE